MNMRRRTDTVANIVFEPPAPAPTVLDALDRLLGRGVVAHGDVMLGLAGVDLIYLRLSALLCGASRVFPRNPLPPRRRRPRRRPRKASR